MRDGRTDGRQTREDKATQPLDDGRLSFAITITNTNTKNTNINIIACWTNLIAITSLLTGCVAKSICSTGNFNFNITLS